MTETGIRSWLRYAEHRPGYNTISGNVMVLPEVHSPQLNNTRDLIVYLPPSHGKGDWRYPVIYMQDGQNLFDEATGFGGWEWHVDETLESLSQSGVEAIAVGIPHAGDDRISEYSAFEGFRPGRGNAYISFVTDTVKPLVEAAFQTETGPKHTGMLGSSMGGLISLYGFFSRPDVFGFTGSLSPALWYARGAIYAYVRKAPFNPGRIYLDHGSRENSAVRMSKLLVEKGYRAGEDLVYLNEDGGEHNEAAWARRLPDALRFLLQA
jgi:predicted alpha/beta superfamily hydrolase